jgi:hypothetical protein
VAGPVKSDDAEFPVLGDKLCREFFCRFIVLVASEPVSEDHYLLYFMQITAIEFAPDAVSGFIDVKIFFHLLYHITLLEPCILC